jgi:O-antigen ligase
MSRTKRCAGLSVSEAAALSLFALAPMAFVPGALNRFVFAKAAVAVLAATIALGAPAHGRLDRRAGAALVAAAVIVSLSACVNAEAVSQLVGRPPRYEGAVMLAVYLAALLTGARLIGSGARRTLAVSWMLLPLTLSAVAIGTIAVIESFGGRPLPTSVARPGSLLGNASELGAWAVLVLGPLALAAVRRRRPAAVAGTTAAVAAVVCSGSRGAVLGAIVAGSVLAVGLKQPRFRLALGVGTVLVVLVAALLPASGARVRGESPSAAKTAEGRQLLWEETSGLIADHPLLGVGPNAFAQAVVPRHDDRYRRVVAASDPVDSPHNWILQATMAGGLPLAALAVALALATLWSGLRDWRAAPDGHRDVSLGLVAGLAGYAVALLFHFTSPGTTPLAALFAGALLARPPRAPNRRPATVPRRALVAGGLGATLVLWAAAVAERPLHGAIAAASVGDVRYANSGFERAARLRPWDPGVSVLALHVDARLAQAGVAEAAWAGRRWMAAALAAEPRTIAVLLDAAVIADATGDGTRARDMIARARRLAPGEPSIREAACTLQAAC